MRRRLLVIGSAWWLSACLGPRECRSTADCLPNSFCEKPPTAELGVCRQEGDGGR
ncbi:MAG: hypothetical protein SFW67_12025 [Myxococcaceae bacterium]|nr:hypothetical protein [Myxococcaceae bacterium]